MPTTVYYRRMSGVGNLKKARQRKFLFLLIIFLVINLILLGLVYLVIYSSFFQVKEFNIEASSSFPSGFLKTALVSQMFNDSWRSWLGPDNIFFWQFGEKPKTLPEVPNLKFLDIKVNFWQRKVAVKVQEREFLGILCQKENCFSFDEEGILFAAAPNVEGSLILKIDDLNEPPRKLGEPILENPDWFKNILAVIEIFQKSGLGPTRVMINDKKLREWEIDLDNGPKFYFSFDNLPAQLKEVLNNLKDKLNFNQLQYLDFRVPNRVYYKPR